MICLVSLTSRPNNWASLKKEKGRVLWTFWFRVLCLFYLAKVKGGPTVFGLSALSLLFFGGWLQYYPTWKGRVLRTCSVGLCLFYLTKVEGGPTVFGLSAFAIFRWLARATSHLERQRPSNSAFFIWLKLRGWSHHQFSQWWDTTGKIGFQLFHRICYRILNWCLNNERNWSLLWWKWFQALFMQ